MTRASVQPAAATGISSDAAILQYVVDNIPYLIFWKDRNSVYLGCNKNFAALDGKADPRELVGRTDFDMAWKEHAHLYRAGDLATMTGGQAILDKEETSIDPAGNETVILTSKVPLRDARGEVAGILGIIVDITARKRMETELKRAKQVADHAAQAKSDFVANVTHELRTPLTLILGPLSRVLQDPALSDASRRQLESARRNGFRLHNLVNDVLDFSKAEATGVVAHREPVELVSELRTLIGDMQLQAELRQLRLGMSTDLERLDALLDTKLLERMVVNLVGNAIKFTPSGGQVELRLARVGDDVRIAVVDNGIGIPKAALDTLFEKFTQVDDSTTRRHEGTGLGLALVRHFAGALGGRVSVESEEGKGSEFTLLLPFIPCAAGAANVERREPVAGSLGTHGYRQQIVAEAPRAAAGPSVLTSAEHRPWVLVAEDNAELRQFTMETLAKDFSVVGVANGVEAWKALSERRFDVVVSDLMMPELDGLGLTAKIKAHPALRTVPVILVTARGGVGSLTVGLDAGADDYLSKPYASEELVARVRAAYRMRSLQDQLREQARAAGVAVAASGILHNVGNVLNRVSVSADLLQQQAAPVQALEKLGEIWAERCKDAASTVQFLTEDERGQRFGSALQRIIAQLTRAQDSITNEARIIGDGVSHAAAIIGRQLGANAQQHPSEVTDVAELVQKALELSAAGSDEPSVRVRAELDQLPVLYADPHSLLQVFVNLLNNSRQAIARQASPEGEIHILARRDDRDIVVQFRDTGSGIGQEDMSRLFQQGFSTRDGGHGLGLHMSCLTVNAMGGSLHAESPGEGRGATFTVRLPLEQRQSLEPGVASVS